MTSIDEHERHRPDDDVVVDAELVQDPELVQDADATTVPLPVIEPAVIERTPPRRPGGELVKADRRREIVEYRPAVRVLIARRIHGIAVGGAVVPALARGGRAAGHGAAVVARAGVRHGWFTVAGAGVAWRRWQDSRGLSRYERMQRAAEIAGDREQLMEWEQRAAAERQRRHERRIAWMSQPVALARAAGIGLGVVVAGLLLLGVVLAVGHGDLGYVLAPIGGVVDAVTAVAGFLTTWGPTLAVFAAAAGLVYLWALGRARVEPPAWIAPAGAEPGGRDVVPDERAITNALRNLNLPALNRKFREGWAPRWVMPPVHDGQGWRAQLLLPESVPVAMIVDAKPVLAHNLLRLPVEVWPTEPRDQPSVLDLYVADQGSLTKPVAPWPLRRDGTADYFRGVPVGVDPRGKTVLGRLFEANWGVAGMMGSGKSTLIITALLGAILDPLVEVDVFCMAINADYDPLRPRLRTLFVSDDPDQIPTVLGALKALMSELSDRGRALSAAGEPKLTRKLAEADPAMRPRVVVIDECQELFVSPVGEEAAELVEKIVAKARKYGVTLIFATPVPSADSLPRKVAKVLSNRACFAIGDHQGNDAIMGTGKHKAGITATSLRPMTIDSDGTVDLGDIGTAMTSGFTPADGLLRCFYVRRGDGVDDVTPVVKRAMQLREGIPPAEQPAAVEPDDEPDHLADIDAVLTAAGVVRMRTQEVLSALAARDHATYGKWTFTDLRDALPDGAKPYKTAGVQQVSLARVREALADRENAGTNGGADPDDAADASTDMATESDRE